MILVNLNGNSGQTALLLPMRIRHTGRAAGLYVFIQLSKGSWKISGLEFDLRVVRFRRTNQQIAASHVVASPEHETPLPLFTVLVLSSLQSKGPVAHVAGASQQMETQAKKLKL